MNPSPALVRTSSTPTGQLSIDERSDEELDAVPYGVIALDPRATILRYNLYEARFARLDRNQVLGRNFFSEIAPCTRRPEFEGRFQKFVARADDGSIEQFEYLFDFKFGAQTVDVELLRAPGTDRFYLLINRRARTVEPAASPPAGPVGVAQHELAPDESSLGVRRNGAGQRSLELPWTFFSALRTSAERLAPRGWQTLCQDWGLQWGRMSVIDLQGVSLERYGKSLRELPMRVVAELYAEHLRAQGWGQVAFDFGAAQEGAVLVLLARSALAESTRRTELPSCQLLAGAINAFFNHLTGRRLAVRELSCACQQPAASRCTFAVVGESRREALEQAAPAGVDAIEALLAALRALPAPPASANEVTP